MSKTKVISVRVPEAFADKLADLSDGSASDGARKLMQIGMRIADPAWVDVLFDELPGLTLSREDFGAVLTDVVTRRVQSPEAARMVAMFTGHADALTGLLQTSGHRVSAADFLADPDAHPAALRMLTTVADMAAAGAFADAEELEHA